MAQATGMSQSAVSRIWRAFWLKPHVVKTWKRSTDPVFVDKVRDVVGVYLSPPEGAPERTQPVLPVAASTTTATGIRSSCAFSSPSTPPSPSPPAMGLWDVALPDADDAMRQICQALHRDFTQEERSQYLPDQPSNPVCPT
jgi:hypothetical protein